MPASDLDDQFRAMPLYAELTGVAQHVEQAERIRTFLPHALQLVVGSGRPPTEVIRVLRIKISRRRCAVSRVEDRALDLQGVLLRPLL